MQGVRFYRDMGDCRGCAWFSCHSHSDRNFVSDTYRNIHHLRASGSEDTEVIHDVEHPPDSLVGGSMGLASNPVGSCLPAQKPPFANGRPNYRSGLFTPSRRMSASAGGRDRSVMVIVAVPGPRMNVSVSEVSQTTYAYAVEKFPARAVPFCPTRGLSGPAPGPRSRARSRAPCPISENRGFLADAKYVSFATGKHHRKTR